jgi:hypothetical protein
MRRLSVTALHDGPLVRAADVACAAPHSGCGAAEAAAAAEPEADAKPAKTAA